MNRDYSDRDIAEILIDTTGHAVRTEDRHYTAEVIQTQEERFRKIQRNTARRDPPVADAYERTIDAYLLLPTPPHSKGSSFRLMTGGIPFTFLTDNPFLRVLGFILAGILIISTLMAGFRLRAGIQEMARIRAEIRNETIEEMRQVVDFKRSRQK